jgi:hypothetical protein
VVCEGKRGKRERFVCIFIARGGVYGRVVFLKEAVRSLHAGMAGKEGGRLTFFVYAGSLGKPLDGWVILVLYRKEL